jgi:hypothetical protein
MAKHEHENLIRYAEGDLSEAEKSEIESHLRNCSECSGFLSFTIELKNAFQKMPPDELTPDTPCPDSETLVAFAAGQLDEKDAQLVRNHAAFCKDCLDELDLLRQTTQAAGIRFAEASWREIVERMKEFVIDLGKIYGPQALVGSIRIVAEQPALAVRGGEPSPVASKVLEVSVGENTYSVQLTVTEESVSCDIAGSRTTQKVPLNASVQSETGDELVSTKSDEFGNSRFMLPSAPGGIYILTLSIEDIQQQILFRAPEMAKPC